MVKSFRGKDVDMVALAKRQGKNIALGNSGTNGFGDIVKNGKIVKTREEVLADWYATHTVTKETVGMKETSDTNTPEVNDEEVLPEKTITKGKPKVVKEEPKVVKEEPKVEETKE